MRMKITTFGILLACTLPCNAQSDNHAAPGIVAPNAPRIHVDGSVSPPPAERANGGVGGQELPGTGAQTRSGGPVGGQKRD